MSEIFKLAEKGFGVHTFEIKMVRLNKSDYHTIRDRIADRAIMDKENKCYIVKTPRHSGLRIKLYMNCGHPPYLSVIVNPNQMIGDIDPCHILTCFDKEELRSILDQELKGYLGNEFGLSRYQLTRIDCTVDFIMDSSELTNEYILLASRCLRINKLADTFGFYKNAELSEDGNEPDYETKHCFRMANKGYYSFTVYDKLYDIIDKGHYENKPYPYGRLRFELALMHRKIRDVSLALDSNDIMELVEYFTCNSEKILKQHISSKIIAGDHYSCSSAAKLLEEKGITGKKTNRLLWILSTSRKTASYNELMFLIDNELNSNTKLRTDRELMHQLNISPIAINRNDYLPGIHTMFGIERKGDLCNE